MLAALTHQREMPRDMAVEGPDTRIICVILHDNVSVWPQHLSVTTFRVVRVNERLTVIKAFPFVQNVHVVAMEIYWLNWV